MTQSIRPELARAATPHPSSAVWSVVRVALSRAVGAKAEAGLFAFLAVLPLLPYLVVLARGVPRYSLVADFALIEQHVRHVLSGETLLGLQSRYPWHHPGPMHFYFVAPFSAMCGKSSTGLFLGTWVLIALAVGSVAATTRVSSTRTTSLAVLAGITAWFSAFGDVATNPWGRIVPVVPLLAYVVFAALFARGVTVAAYALAFFGALVTETHVSTVPTVGVLGTLALGSFVYVSRARRTLGNDAQTLARAALLLGLLLSPMLVEQYRAPAGAGNLSRLIAFFAAHREAPHEYARAVKDWALATSWLPSRALNHDLVSDGPWPMMLRWEAVPAEWTAEARRLACVHVGTALGASWIALRRRDYDSLALLAFGIAGEASAMGALLALVGEDHYSLIFWVAAPSAVTWMGVLSTAFRCAEGPIQWLGARLGISRRRLAPAAAVLGFALVMKTTLVQRAWNAHHPHAPSTTPELGLALQGLVTGVEARLAQRGETPVIHLAGDWVVAAGVALELERDAIDVRYSRGELHTFAGAKSGEGVTRPLHLWIRSKAFPTPPLACATVVSNAGPYEVLGAPNDAPGGCAQD